MPKPLVMPLVAVLVLYTAQQLLTPVLAPLARELALGESELGLVITVAALALTVASPLWGRAMDRIGLRAVLLTGLGLATAGLAGFAAVAAAGLAPGSTPGLTLVLMLVTRSVVFGVGLAAVPVAALTVATSVTGSEAERTKAVGVVGAAQGVSLVLGPAAGGLLAVGSLLLPLYVAPAVSALLLLVVAARVRTVPAADSPAAEPAARPRSLVRDPRVLPLLAIGFLLYLSLGLVQVVIGFLVADRLGTGPQATAGAVALVLVMAGVVLVGVQGGVVPRLGWSPRRLMRTGAPIAVAGLLLLAPAGRLWLFVVAFGVLALGLGLAMPGFATAPSLVVGPERHGAVAGLVNATMGTTFVVGPLLGTALYELTPVVPVLGAALAALAAGVLVWLAPAAHSAAPAEQPA